jgi:hypothetical protein
MDDALIEKAALAIREVICERIWASSYPGVKPPIPWDKLKEEQREGYRNEARAAFEVFRLLQDQSAPAAEGVSILVPPIEGFPASDPPSPAADGSHRP